MANQMTLPRFCFSFATENWQGLGQQLHADGFLFPTTPPKTILGVDDQPDLCPHQRGLIEAGRPFMANHQAFEHFAIGNGLVRVAVRCRSYMSEIRSYIVPLNFELFTAGTVHLIEWDDLAYVAPSFADMHYPHGWACAFKGPGHDRLVSRRWLEHGPWRLIRDNENDVSFVQF